VPDVVTTIDAMATYPIRTRHWTRKEYEHVVELGVLHEDEPIELIGGHMIVAEPKNSVHEPIVAPAGRFGWKYDRVRILKPEATVCPLALPSTTIAVADLLP
jgi:hypothetical protein